MVIAIAMASHKKSRVYLSLEKKVEIIKHTQSNSGLSLRSLEILFGCGKTQIGKILKNKESILASYQSNAAGSRVHTISKARNSEYSEINDALYKWFVLARSKNIPVGGPQLIEKAKMIATTLGKPEFKGSQGWLEKWKKRFAIKQLKIGGESGEVQGETVDSWKERLPEIVQGYSKDNIWNMDETGCSFVLFLTEVLPKRVGVAREGRNPSRGSPSLCLSLLQVTKRSQYSSGCQRIRGAYVGLTSLAYLFHTTVRVRHGCLEKPLKISSISLTDACSSPTEIFFC